MYTSLLCARDHLHDLLFSSSSSFLFFLSFFFLFFPFAFFLWPRAYAELNNPLNNPSVRYIFLVLVRILYFFFSIFISRPTLLLLLLSLPLRSIEHRRSHLTPPVLRGIRPTVHLLTPVYIDSRSVPTNSNVPSQLRTKGFSELAETFSFLNFRRRSTTSASTN